MNFEEFKSVDSANVRKPGTFTKEQTFEDLRYKKATKKKTGVTEGRFYISDVRFDAWGLDGEKGLRQFIHPTNGSMLLAVVAEKDATMVKSKENAKVKGRNFKSIRIEVALEKAGILTGEVGVNQMLKLNEVGKNVTIDGYACEYVYTISKGERKPQKEKAVKAEAEVAATPAAAPVAEATASAAPATEAKKPDWD